MWTEWIVVPSRRFELRVAAAERLSTAPIVSLPTDKSAPSVAWDWRALDKWAFDHVFRVQHSLFPRVKGPCLTRSVIRGTAAAGAAAG